MSCFELPRPLELVVLQKAIECSWSFYRIRVFDVSAESELLDRWHRSICPSKSQGRCSCCWHCLSHRASASFVITALLAVAINWFELLLRNLAVIQDNLGLIFSFMLGKRTDTHIHKIRCTYFYVDCTDSRLSILKWIQTKNFWRKQVFSALKKLAIKFFICINMDFWPSPYLIYHFLGLQT